MDNKFADKEGTYRIFDNSNVDDRQREVPCPWTTTKAPSATLTLSVLPDTILGTRIFSHMWYISSINVILCASFWPFKNILSVEFGTHIRSTLKSKFTTTYSSVVCG